MMVVVADSPTPAAPAPAPAPDGASPVVVWPAILRGALVGVVLLAVVSVIAAIIDHNVRDFDDSGWIYPLFVATLASYGVAGWIGGRAAPAGPLSSGALAGVFAFVFWIPVRILIWLVRDEHKGLFTGHAPVLRPGQLFGHLVIAAGLGMVGGWLASRVVVRRAKSDMSEHVAS